MILSNSLLVHSGQIQKLTQPRAVFTFSNNSSKKMKKQMRLKSQSLTATLNKWENTACSFLLSDANDSVKLTSLKENYC